VEVEASRERAWSGLGTVLSAMSHGSRRELGARALGCRDRSASGPPDAQGSTLPGFRIEQVERPSQLALEGRHRFSRYALIFRLDELPGERSRVRAETRAAFPGLRGRLYRALVIGTRSHTVAVHRMLSAVKRRAEQK
jgi:hypothetical protein